MSNVLGPTIVVLAFVALTRAGFNAEAVHFAIARHTFRAELASEIADPAPFRTWPWGFSGGGIVTASERLVVFDPSGGMMLEQRKRSPEWYRKAELTALDAKISFQYMFFPNPSDYSVRHASIEDVGQGFYIVTQYQ